MGAIRHATRRAAGKAKEAVAELLGDGKLQEEAWAEQREAVAEGRDDDEPAGRKSLGNLHRLT